MVSEPERGLCMLRWQEKCTYGGFAEVQEAPLCTLPCNAMRLRL
jgi:hypothetical protein